MAAAAAPYTSCFVFHVVTHFRSSKYIYRPNFINIFEFTAEIKLLIRWKNRRPPYCIFFGCYLLKTQLTQITTPKEAWINKRKEDIKTLYIYPRFLSKQSKCFLKVAIVSQLIKDIGKLFHMSIILTVKKIPYIQMHLWFVDFE